MFWLVEISINKIWFQSSDLIIWIQHHLLTWKRITIHKRLNISFCYTQGHSGVQLTCNTYNKSTTYMGFFKPRLHTLKVIPWPWASGSKQIWIKSLNTNIALVQGAAKNTKGQSWRLKENLPVWPQAYAHHSQIRLGQFDLWYFYSHLTKVNV